MTCGLNRFRRGVARRREFRGETGRAGLTALNMPGSSPLRNLIQSFWDARLLKIGASHRRDSHDTGN